MKHIHVLTDNYEIRQRHFVRKISKGRRSLVEVAEVQVSGSATMRLKRRNEKSRKKWIALTLTLPVTMDSQMISRGIGVNG